MAPGRVIWESNKRRFEWLGGEKVEPPVHIRPITTQVKITKPMIPLLHLPVLNGELFT
jgi:hypothetical protein